MANDNTFTIPDYANRNGFTPVSTQAAEAVGLHWAGIKDTVVCKKGDILILDAAGGALLGGDTTVTEKTFLGICAAGAGSVTAAANASTKVSYYPWQANLEYYAKVGTGTIAAADTIVPCSFDNEYSIDVDNAGAANDFGFLAIAFDATNGFGRGRFVFVQS